MYTTGNYSSINYHHKTNLSEAITQIENKTPVGPQKPSSNPFLITSLFLPKGYSYPHFQITGWWPLVWGTLNGIIWSIRCI